ncbi:hypothetical protein [Streptomyces sp. NPDC093970]|uniref:hypothetical protein n=1 Tax=Streptomyces sp. NPDC093970 TaxID=3155076 RepID=UPI00342AB41A
MKRLVPGIAGVLGALCLALVPASAEAAPSHITAPTAARTVARPADTSQGQRCWSISNGAPGTAGNHLCVEVFANWLGVWTQVRTTYYKATSGPVTVQLGWGYAERNGSGGNATGYYSITGPTTTSYTWNLSSPSGCIIGTMNVSGQGHFDTLYGSPGDGEFCTG